jgi:aldehyde dehydrogenase (NAD+)
MNSHPNEIQKDFFTACATLADLIQKREKELVKLLSAYETYETARDEITRSIDALSGAEKEISVIKDPLSDLTISTFFPLNLPLYSLIILGIMPSFFAKDVFLRPPEVMYGILGKLYASLDIHNLFPRISLNATPRHIFVDLYATESDVIIFTGKYENALAVHDRCPYSLLIYNGSGINPFILFKNADVTLAVEKAVEMRCFNSGQDCAGPDAFFVASELADDFVQQLTVKLKTIKVGATSNPDVRVGSTMKQSYIAELKNWLSNEKDYTVFGGEIDEIKHFAYPTIVRKNIKQLADNVFHEFFAPYFYILEYDSDKELSDIITSESFVEHGMYVSVFGNNSHIEKQLKSVRILRNIIVNDYERGNEQYGGYGAKANFLLYGDKKSVHPILISRDMNEILVKQST